MATNNYYNFTHGGTQYGAAYTAGQGQGTTPYQQQASTGYGTSPVPVQAYGTPGGVSTDQYMLAGYTRPAAAQQQTGGYYSQQMTGYSTATAQMGSIGKAQQSARPAATSTVYPTYSANTTPTTSASYAGFAPPQTQTAGAGKSFTNYDAAVYNAVSAYAQGGTGHGGGGSTYKGRGGMKGGFNKGQRPMPKPQTLHYCDVCKISCAGPQTYKEHLEGQKHKKKEAAMKSGIPIIPKSGPAGLKCELCDVTCTGSDAYAAHIRGAKHQKVVKLHTKLGKPIPITQPTVIPPSASPQQNSNGVHSSSHTAITTTPSTASSVPNTLFAKPAIPKINYVGNNNKDSQATNTSSTTNREATNQTAEKTNQYQPMSTTLSSPAAPGNVSSNSENSSNSLMDYIEKDVQPVGQDYIEEIRNEEGKVVSFNCKLCECRFNDPNAKEMHMKGRRHRLQYKKKVNPDLVVDVKPSSRQKKLEDRRGPRAGPIRKLQPNDPYGRGPVPLMPGHGPRGFGPGQFGPSSNPYFMSPVMRRSETLEDHHIMEKHAEIYPEEAELQAIQKIVSNTEKALKFVSDHFAEEDWRATAIKAEDETQTLQPTDADLQGSRKLKGVMRVGNLAKGLLLCGDRHVELAVLCSEKPTASMLARVFECLPKQMEIVAPEEKYEMKSVPEKARIVVSSSNEPKIEVTITLTSPLLRSGPEAPGEAQATQEPNDLLDKEKCLDALAALRHAKWFQARATSLQSCVIVIRILRDICRRVPAFNCIPTWGIELLTEKAINSAGIPVSPGEALKIIFEILASGILLQFGPGLLDPCEKESTDALAGLSNQAREDVTAYAQQAIRQIAFGQIHIVLGMEALSSANKKASFGNRKRRRDASGNQGDETDTGNDGKKDKKEDIKIESVEIKAEVVS